MPDIQKKLETQELPLVKEADLLSFKPTGRPLPLESVAEEFALMQSYLKQPLTVEVAARICQRSGSHLLKSVSPRVEGDHALLRFDPPESNRRSTLGPSTNPPDIPFCKVVYRPLEVIGYPTLCVIDHILNPEDNSKAVLEAFAEVFGEDVLQVMQQTLHAMPRPPLNLGVGEFPIIFIPRPGGGDIQITPVAPATAFMGMKRVSDLYFQKAQPGGPRPLRGRWTKQVVSANPQNISGAIGGPRVRFLATMPPTMTQEYAEVYRYIHGGSFPRWRNEEVTSWVLRYADMVDADATYNNENTRAALDRTADQLIRNAREFSSDTLQEARDLAKRQGLSEEEIPKPPSVALILIRRNWASEGDYGRARKVLTSPHFEHRLLKSRDGQVTDHD